VLDGVSLDQLRTFIAAVDEGSFSAASRKLLRAQSVVSDTVSNLEDQIGVPLFDRSGRYPKLTPAGVVLLADARGIVTGVDLLKARAKGMAAGLEPELSVVVDVFYPIDAITLAAKEFREQYPGVALRIYVEALGAAIQPVLDGRCSVGIVGSLPVIPDTLTNERLPPAGFRQTAIACDNARHTEISRFHGGESEIFIGVRWHNHPARSLHALPFRCFIDKSLDPNTANALIIDLRLNLRTQRTVAHQN